VRPTPPGCVRGIACCRRIDDSVPLCAAKGHAIPPGRLIAAAEERGCRQGAVRRVTWSGMVTAAAAKGADWRSTTPHPLRIATAASCVGMPPRGEGGSTGRRQENQWYLPSRRICSASSRAPDVPVSCEASVPYRGHASSRARRARACTHADRPRGHQLTFRWCSILMWRRWITPTIST
jgi:hypothetical protein